MNKHRGDTNENNTNDELKKKAWEQLATVNDEDDVENIRKTIAEAKNLGLLDDGISVEESFAEFKQIYLPRAEKMKGILESAENQEKSSNDIPMKTFRLRPRMAFAATLLLILVVFTTTAMAGINIFDYVVKWSDELFYKETDRTHHDSPAGNKADNLATEYYDFESLEKDCNISIMKPHYVPKEYSLKNINKFNDGYSKSFSANFDNDKGDKIIYIITIPINGSLELTAIDKTAEGVELYTVNSISYYIVENMDWFTACWSDMNIDYDVSGFSSKEDLKKFIDNLKY